MLEETEFRTNIKGMISIVEKEEENQGRITVTVEWVAERKQMRNVDNMLKADKKREDVKKKLEQLDGKELKDSYATSTGKSEEEKSIYEDADVNRRGIMCKSMICSIRSVKALLFI